MAWHDLITPDLEISKQFYSDLFGWTWRAPSSGKGVTYVVGEMTGVAMAGLAESTEGKNPSQWITYFAVNDVHRSVKLATDSGAKVVVKPTTTGSWHDESALLTDPQGAAFALMKPGIRPNDSVTRAGQRVAVGGAVDGEYRGCRGLLCLAAGIPAEAGEGRGARTTRCSSAMSMPIAGMLKIPVEDVRPNWLPTIRVADVDAMVARAVSLGGRVIMAPRADVRNATVAIIADPTGAALTLQEWDGTPARGPNEPDGIAVHAGDADGAAAAGRGGVLPGGEVDVGERRSGASGAVGRGDDREAVPVGYGW